MKKLIFTLACLFAFSTYSGSDAVKAQGFSISINIGVQPAWGPVGYDYVDFYYIPEIDCYYDVPRGLFFYVYDGRWVSGRYLPPYYSRYDLYRLHKVVINGYPQPWRYHNRHYSTYRHYIGRYDQPMIRYSKDRRYETSRRNRYDWVENGRDLHRRSGRSYSEGRSSDNRNYGRSSDGNTGRSANQGRSSINQNQGRSSSSTQNRTSSNQDRTTVNQSQGRTSTSQGRSSSTQSSSQQRSSTVTSRPTTSGNSSTGRSSSSGTTVRSTPSSSSQRGSSSSSSTRGSSSNSGRSSSSERPTSNR